MRRGRWPVRLVCLLSLLALAAYGLGADETTDATAPVPAGESGLKVQYGIEGAVQGTFETHAYWGLSRTYGAKPNWDTSPQWLDTYVKPTIVASKQLGGGEAYGGAGLIFSGTLGTDIFDAGDTGRLLPESAYLGYRTTRMDGRANWDLSAGQQQYSLGNGMLFSVGGGNGYERGAVILSPYRSWQMAAVARYRQPKFNADAFWLEPDDLASAPTGTKLAGVKAEFTPDARHAYGLVYVKALESTMPYPTAAVTIIPDGRDGLDTYYGYWRWNPSADRFSGFSWTGDVAYERNSRIDMAAWGGGTELGYRFATRKYMPRVSYSPRYFSGDDPTTNRYERFDSLYFDGAANLWAGGSNASLAFYNSNTVTHRLRVDLMLSQRDFLALSYWNVRAAQVNSPLQFGQAARLSSSGSAPTLVAGVPRSKLSDDLYIEYTRMLDAHRFVTAGLAASYPGKGIDALAGGKADDWYGGYVNFAYKY